MTELNEARSAWESRTGRKSQNDGLDDDLAFCLRLESRSSDLEGLPEMPLLNQLTMFEQALFSWSTSLDSPLRLYSAQCEAWAGTRPLEGITATSAPATNLPFALVYGGRIGSPSHLLSVQRDSSGHSMPLLCIIPYVTRRDASPRCLQVWSNVLVAGSAQRGSRYEIPGEEVPRSTDPMDAHRYFNTSRRELLCPGLAVLVAFTFSRPPAYGSRPIGG
jgi:hypothetical protein